MVVFCSFLFLFFQINDLQVRIVNLNGEKVTEKGRLHNLNADLQTCRKEVMMLSLFLISEFSGIFPVYEYFFESVVDCF